LAWCVRTVERLSVPAMDDELYSRPVGDLLGSIDGLSFIAEHGGDPLAALALDGPTFGMRHDVLVSVRHKISSRKETEPAGKISLKSIRQEAPLR
jgi:hypothetical protein